MISARSLATTSLRRVGIEAGEPETAVPKWETIARPNQIAPHGKHPIEEMRRDDWLIWYVQAGRGWGKTLTGAQ